MPCTPIKLPGGGVAIACTRGRRPRRTPDCSCCTQREGPLLCDFPIGNGKTCDKPLCRDCARRVGPNRDYCPSHPHQLDLVPR